MNIISFGGGTNSSAMIIGLYQRNIPIDLILFADTGGEKPHTYEFIKTLNSWLADKGLPEVTVVKAVHTLEYYCLKYEEFPSVVYGAGHCAVRHKIAPQEKFCNNDQQCKAVWSIGEKVNKYVGYDAGEQRRIDKNKEKHDADKKYKHHFPLIEWGWTREECIAAIEGAGLPLPGKSSCFFCPNNRKEEIVKLWKNHPDLFDRCVAMEHNARTTKRDGTPSSIIGLGRTWTWEQYRKEYEHNEQWKADHFVLPGFEESTGGCCCGNPCGCSED